MINWKPIETAPWDINVLLMGDSGYAYPHQTFIINGYRIRDWHAGVWKMGTWLNMCRERLSDIEWFPTHWAEIPEFSINNYVQKSNIE